MNDDLILTKGRECLELEADAIRSTKENLGEQFIRVLKLLESCVEQGKKVIFSGVGKNEPICEKIKATFNSTGVSAVYLDPLKALHGDLGICDEGDVAFLFSNSGGAEELIVLSAFLKRLGVTTIAYTSSPNSELVKKTDDVICYQYKEEACPLSLAPTSSTTAALALGDAIAMVFLEMRGFSKEDFAQYHPSGSLGKSLLLKVNEVMRKDDRMATLKTDCNIRDAIEAITGARCGTLALVDSEEKLVGVFSDGDFRRASMKESDVMSTPVEKYMTRGPVTISVHALAAEALKIFENHHINDLIVVDDDQKPVGLIDGQDLPSLRLV